MPLLLNVEIRKKIVFVEANERELINKCMTQRAFFKTSPLTSTGIRLEIN